MRSSSIGGCLHLKDLQNMVWSYKLKFKIWVWSKKRLLRYSIFNILRSSSNGGYHLFKAIFFWFGPLSFSLKFEEDLISGCWDIQLLIFLRLSSIEGCLHFNQFTILVWSLKLKFKIWGRSDQWLLRYSTFNILRSSSV